MGIRHHLNEYLFWQTQIITNCLYFDGNSFFFLFSIQTKMKRKCTKFQPKKDFRRKSERERKSKKKFRNSNRNSVMGEWTSECRWLIIENTFVSRWKREQKQIENVVWKSAIVHGAKSVFRGYKSFNCIVFIVKMCGVVMIMNDATKRSKWFWHTNWREVWRETKKKRERNESDSYRITVHAKVSTRSVKCYETSMCFS